MSGASIPIETFLFGRMFSIFVSFNVAEQITANINVTEQCTSDLVPLLVRNGSNGSQGTFCDISEPGNVISTASIYVCDPKATLIDETTAHSLYFVYLAIGVFVSDLFAQLMWTISASRQSKRMRVAFYNATLNRSISWFDTSDVSQLATHFSM